MQNAVTAPPCAEESWIFKEKKKIMHTIVVHVHVTHLKPVLNDFLPGYKH